MINGGSSDSELNALTVVPCGRSPSIAVTTDERGNVWVGISRGAEEDR